MKRVLLSALSALAIAAPASAAPPPLPVAITPIPLNLPGTDSGVKVNGLVQSLIEAGWFSKVPSGLNQAWLRCLWEQDIPACLRGHSRGALGKGPPEVFLLVTPEAGRARIRCVGPGETSRDPEKQTALIDLVSPSREDRNATAACIISAAAESGW